MRRLRSSSFSTRCSGRSELTQFHFLAQRGELAFLCERRADRPSWQLQPASARHGSRSAESALPGRLRRGRSIMPRAAPWSSYRAHAPLAGGAGRLHLATAVLRPTCCGWEAQQTHHAQGHLPLRQAGGCLRLDSIHMPYELDDIREHRLRSGVSGPVATTPPRAPRNCVR